MPLLAALSDRVMARLRLTGLALFFCIFFFYIWDTIHWPMIWDTPIMHYVRFLMSRGLRPYSQITDMNLPGCYLTEGWGMAIFGWGDLAWRIHEFVQMAVLAAAGAVFGGRRNWFAGIFAATFFLVMHASEGPRVATERDELMAVLLVAASALAVVAVRRSAPAWMLGAGLAAGLATSLKPAGLLMDVGLLLLLVWEKRRRGQASTRYVWCMVAGNAVIVAIMVGFLASNQAFGPLWFILTKIVPNYTKLVQPGAGYMLRHLLPASIVPLIIAGFMAAIATYKPKHERMKLEQAILLLGMGVGTVSYFMQEKGLTYHRYMVVIFVLLAIGWQISEAMHREHNAARWTAIAAVVVLFVVVVPYYVRLTLRSPRDAYSLSPLAFTLQDDLARLGGDRLQKQVLCLDVIEGCFDALYRLRLEQSTGATGDLLLFAPQRDFAVDYYRAWFLAHDRDHPANVVVLVNEWYQNNEVASFDKLHAWPQYERELLSEYTPVVERRFGPEVSSPAYRIYLRKGSDVMLREEAIPLR